MSKHAEFGGDLEALEVGSPGSLHLPRQKQYNLVPLNTINQEREDLPIGKKRLLFFWTILSTCLYTVAFLGSLGMCLMTPMVFDSGFSFTGFAILGIVFCIPFSIIGAIVLSWKAYNNRNYKAVIAWNSFPVLALLAIIVDF